jgi:hypothetical protein
LNNFVTSTDTDKGNNKDKGKNKDKDKDKDRNKEKGVGKDTTRISLHSLLFLPTYLSCLVFFLSLPYLRIVVSYICLVLSLSLHRREQ